MEMKIGIIVKKCESVGFCWYSGGVGVDPGGFHLQLQLQLQHPRPILVLRGFLIPRYERYKTGPGSNPKKFGKTELRWR